MTGLFSLAALGPLTAVFWIVQLALIVHVIRTGRPFWWIWILLAAPLIGGLAYIVVELAPELRGTHGMLAGMKPRKWRIAERRRRLEETDTVKNRLALAAELSEAGQVKEASEVAAGCLQGVFKDDARTLVAVARHAANVGAFEEALGYLGRVDTTGDRMLEVDLGLVRGDCLAGLGRLSEAERAYSGILDRYFGEAARAGLACVYERSGRAGQAAAIWAEIRAKYRGTSPAWRRSERKWYELAKARARSAPG